MFWMCLQQVESAQPDFNESSAAAGAPATAASVAWPCTNALGVTPFGRSAARAPGDAVADAQSEQPMAAPRASLRKQAAVADQESAEYGVTEVSTLGGSENTSEESVSGIGKSKGMSEHSVNITGEVEDKK